MASNAVKECTICTDEFDEDEKCPRNLPCSHTFCTQCITQLIHRNKKKCPFCLQSFRANSAKELKVNIVALDLLKFIKSLEGKSVLSGIASAKTLVKKAKEMKENIYEVNNQTITSLKTAEDRVEKAIDSNEEIKQEILVNHCQLKYEITSKLMSLDRTCEMKLKYVDEEIAKLEKLLKRIREQMNNLDEAKNKLDASEKLDQLGEAIDQADAFNDAAQSWLQNYKSFIARDENAHQGIKENIKVIQEKISSLRKIVDSSVPENQNLVEHVAVTLLQELLEPETVERMNPSKMYFPRLEEIMAVQTLDGKTRCAKFSIHENRLCLHSLRDIQQLPSNIYTVEHRDVMSLVDPSSRTAFLDIGTNESTLGRIFIRLTPDTKRAKNFFLLCSGESGPSYLNTVLLYVQLEGEPGEYVVGGDYEYDDGEGGKGVVPELGDERGGVLVRPFLAGSVSESYYGDKYAAQFEITTRDNPGCSYSRVFGQVESGLNILREAITNYPNIKDVRIIDCGIVLDL